MPIFIFLSKHGYLFPSKPLIQGVLDDESFEDDLPVFCFNAYSLTLKIVLSTDLFEIRLRINVLSWAYYNSSITATNYIPLEREIFKGSNKAIIHAQKATITGCQGYLHSNCL